MRPWVVIPAYNEVATIGRVVAAALRHAPVVVVEDGSTDATGAVALAAGAIVVPHPRRRGKGEALRSGIAEARARGASVVLTLDGDGQHDPGDLPALLAMAALDPDAIVVGGRLEAGAPLPAGRLSAILVASFFVACATGLRIRDSQSGFRAYPVRLFDEVELRHGGFVFETEILVAAAARGWRVREVPVTAIPRAGRPSRFRPLADGVAIGAYLARQTLRGGVRRGPGPARAVAAVAVAPLVLGAALLQQGAERWAPNLLRPLVHRVYGLDRPGTAEP